MSICKNDTVGIGGNPAATGGSSPYTYSWSPVIGLSSSTASNPNAFPTASTIYTLTVKDASGNTSQDVISIVFLTGPVVDAGPDQTITGGTNTVLQASGGMDYYWFPDEDLTNSNTATPTAEPVSTTTFCVGGLDVNGCANFDCMTLEVIPSDTLIIYNAFTPNGDGTNDVLYIGNIKKFPENKLEVFNRNGKLVFQAVNYQNDWDGKVEGSELPSATYYIVLSLGSGKGKRQGAVTIIR
jgi:gliding motility-associated-like protein